jgi:hypothetical protein
VTDGEDTTMEGKQMAAVDPPPDEPRGQAQRNQLTASDDAVLSLCQPANQLGRAAFRAVTVATPTTRIAFASYFLANARRVMGAHRERSGRHASGAN